MQSHNFFFFLFWQLNGLFRPYPTPTYEQFVHQNFICPGGSYCNTCFVRGVTSVILLSPGFRTIMYIVVTFFAFPISVVSDWPTQATNTSHSHFTAHHTPSI